MQKRLDAAPVTLGVALDPQSSTPPSTGLPIMQYPIALGLIVALLSTTACREQNPNARPSDGRAHLPVRSPANGRSGEDAEVSNQARPHHTQPTRAEGRDTTIRAPRERLPQRDMRQQLATHHRDVAALRMKMAEPRPCFANRMQRRLDELARGITRIRRQLWYVDAGSRTRHRETVNQLRSRHQDLEHAMYRLQPVRRKEAPTTLQRMNDRIATLNRDIQDAAHAIAQSIETNRP